MSLQEHLNRGVPRQLLAVSPVSANPQPSRQRGFVLPLNLIFLIVSYIEDIADIAAITRTCRLMYYMTVPQLYKKVTLRSHSKLRYINGLPEGAGSASPFTVALSGLATNNSATLVREFNILGSWLDPRSNDYAKGLVPDSTMLLGVAIRAAIDKMTNLTSFRWELDTKPLKTVYQGLSARSTLTSLTLKFPVSQDARPVTVVPPIPSLRKLRILDIDPSSFPDDISTLLLYAKHLDDLRLHWNPRVREVIEPVANMRLYFDKVLDHKCPLQLKHLALQNYHGLDSGHLKDIADPSTLESVQFSGCFGGPKSSLATFFVDAAWKDAPHGGQYKKLKRVMIDEPARNHAKTLETFSGLEEFYVVSSKSGSRNSTPVLPDTSATSSTFSPTAFSSPGRPSSWTGSTPRLSDSEQADMLVGKEYLHALQNNHGPTLRKLLLSDRWPLSGTQISELVSSCPNLEQLGIAVSGDEAMALRILAPFLTNLRSIRILNSEHLQRSMREDPELMEVLNPNTPEPQLWRHASTTHVRWAGIGDYIFRLGNAVKAPDADGRLEWRREAWRATLEDVKDVEIWKNDTSDIMAMLP